MRIVTKVKSEELEIIKIYISLGFTITVEIFTVPEGYKSLANNSFPQHDELLGTGVHKNKKESVKLAIKDLRELMEAFEE
ncbi:hypothetical protein V7157_08775 [Neobacillus drentensis]|uniref:hypothetical protein n=1 Tax=Neobacillus drentensis TaxID=220684 RepID=UPI003000C973